MDDKNPYTTHIWPCAKENTFYPQPRENEMIITTKMIADIIAHHDPMALFSLGAPDEYFPEAELILEAFERFKSFDDFYKEVYDIFCFMFDDKLFGQFEDYEELSKEIWQLKVLR